MAGKMFSGFPSPRTVETFDVVAAPGKQTPITRREARPGSFCTSTESVCDSGRVVALFEEIGGCGLVSFVVPIGISHSSCPGLNPGIHVLKISAGKGKSWMAGSSPAMTASFPR